MGENPSPLGEDFSLVPYLSERAQSLAFRVAMDLSNNRIIFFSRLLPVVVE